MGALLLARAADLFRVGRETSAPGATALVVIAPSGAHSPRQRGGRSEAQLGFPLPPTPLVPGCRPRPASCWRTPAAGPDKGASAIGPHKQLVY